MVAQRVAHISRTTLITSLGTGVDTHYERMHSGSSGAGKPMQCPPLIEGLTRLETLICHATTEVLPTHIGGRTALIISTTKGDIDYIHSRNPLDFDACKHYLSAHYATLAQPLAYLTVSNACISGVAAVIVADRLIRSGKYDNIVVVGADVMSDFTTSGFKAFKSVSANLCRPYDKSRDGLSLGEACGAMLLTADVALSQGYAVLGTSMTNDANHISGPSRTGRPLADAIEEALREATATPSDVAFVNAHGTATLYNDEMESKALALAGLSHVPLNSLKPYFGHTLGASGVIEIIMSVEQQRRGVLLGTPGFEELGTPEPLNVSPAHRNIAGNLFIKTASGFGGCNAAVAIGTPVAKPHDPYVAALDTPLHTLATVSIARGQIECSGVNRLSAPTDFHTFIRTAYKQLADANAKFFKMSDLCKLGYIGAEHIMREVSADARIDARSIAVVLTNRFSSAETDMQHQVMLDNGENVSPAIFVYTLPNIIIGEVSIRHHLTGEGLFLIDAAPSEVADYARILLSHGRYSAVLVGSCEKTPDIYELHMQMIVKQQ